MKIGYLIPGCGISGGIAVVCQHANRLLKRGHDVIIISETMEKDIHWFPNQEVPIITIDEYENNLDILVATGWSTSFKVVNLPANHKCYFVQSDETRFHENNSTWQHITALSYLLNFNFFTEAQWIQKWLKQYFNHSAELIPNGLDEKIFFPDKPLAPKKQKPRILLEGAIALPYKGMSDAFEAVKDLDAEIWCVSSLGKPKPDWRCDRFFSQVPMEMMRRIYSSCDILLKLSRVEGFFGPPLEMMACGGVVVVGKVSGYDEYIVDGHNALVVEPGDIPSTTAAIKELINNIPLRQSLTQNGFETVKAWGWENSIVKLERYFLNLNQNIETYPPNNVRSLSDQGIALTYDMIANGHMRYNNWEPSVFTEPIDKLLYRIRNVGLAKKTANLIYAIYKMLARLKS
ncbi:MAG: glycosyltransferase family 4 protein [Anaerolineaceae bacterium]|nr:glycosyltransferase family 4 protein [Brevefilum sp.]